jgi:ribosomal protein L20A (L18A)
MTRLPPARRHTKTCTRLLGEMGAEVIKLELAPAGDRVRADGLKSLAPEFKDSSHSTYYLQHNHSKLSFAIDLKKPGAREKMKRRGVEIRLVIEGEAARAARPDPALLNAIARGHRWFHELASGRTASIREIAKREGVNDSYVKRLIPLALLAPEIVQSICDGSQPASLTAEVLKHNSPLPLEWTKQRQILRCG